MYKMGIIIHSACLMGIFIQMQGRTIWEPVITKQSSRCQNIFVCLDHSLLLPHTSAQCGHPFFLVDDWNGACCSQEKKGCGGLSRYPPE